MSEASGVVTLAAARAAGVGDESDAAEGGAAAAGAGAAAGGAGLPGGGAWAGAGAACEPGCVKTRCEACESAIHATI